MFENCSSLTSLDLSNFDTILVTSMVDIFKMCNNLITIYASNRWYNGNLANNDKLFDGCIKLVGAVPYDSTITDATMANATNGYFTFKAPTTDDYSLIIATYCEDDTSLNFYNENRDNLPNINTIYRDKLISQLYIDNAT
jgi:surface protein